jgi:small-conductance mechanosensitive channel
MRYCKQFKRLFHSIGFFTAALSLMMAFPLITIGQETKKAEAVTEEVHREPVTVDGEVLFHVRGVSSLPAEQRAEDIAGRIVRVASDDAISVDSIKDVDAGDRTNITAGSLTIMSVVDADAAADGIRRSLLVELIQNKIKKAVTAYRDDRSRPVLIKSAIRAGTAVVMLILVLLLVSWIMRRISAAVQKRIQTKVNAVDDKSFNLIRSVQVWKTFDLMVSLIRLTLLLSFIVVFIEYVLGIFPWTKPIAKYTLDIVLEPLFSIGKGFVAFLPNLAFLIIIVLTTRYVLKLIYLFFSGIEAGSIVIKSVDPELAMSTYRLVRIGVVVFAAVFAYPYIPGSDSSAFKGVSVFIGVLFSIGSSAFIGNLIAGYSITYRKAFKIGDRIQVDNFIGYVEEQKALVTRIRSLKNEDIVIPNSTLLNSNIINYTKGAKERGVILHTTVGIGYETPWRQVDAMLKMAADRTDGILKEPRPFVLKQSLGDFAIVYEINGYCKEATRMPQVYNELHEHILDLFNENNVQIMTPAYEGDPEIPKVVPKDQWHAPLADEKK